MSDDRIILVHEQGSDSVTFERQTWGRADRQPTWLVCLAPHDVLGAGYDEAVVRLDQQSIDRLRHWLLTGEAFTRDVTVPDVLAEIRAALVEEYGDQGHDTWCPRSPSYEMVSDHPRGDRPCDCLGGKLWPLLASGATDGGDS